MVIRFFHAADLHLESPFAKIQSMPEHWQQRIRNASFGAFDSFVQDAITNKPDFILLAGDIYDGETRSLRAQAYFQKAMETLAQYDIPVYIIHGNHDHLAGNWTRFNLPSNVTIFGETPESYELEIDGQVVQISGFSYPRRHLPESYIEKYPPRKSYADYAIGLLHGSEQTQQEHDVYAPFTIEQLRQTSYDYWALGHIHKRQQLSTKPAIAYAGTLQGRNRKEQGVQGYYHVELSNGEPTLTFQKASQVVFDEIEVVFESTASIDHFQEQLIKALEPKTDHIYTLVQVTIKTPKEDWMLTTNENELREFILEQVNQTNQTVYITHLNLHWTTELDPAFQQLMNQFALPTIPTAMQQVLDSSTLEDQVKERMHAILTDRSGGQ